VVSDTCILIHGFTGNPAELQPLGDALKRNGYETVLPVLAGHCGTVEDMRQATAVAWVESVERLARDLLDEGKNVHLIGFSAGAMIAAILAARYPVQTVTALAPAVFYVGPQQTYRQIANLIKESWNVHGLPVDYLKTRMERMVQTPLKSLQQFRRLVAMGKAAVPKVTQPLCVIQGKKDELVEPRSADFVYKLARSQVKEIHYLPHAGHEVCLGADYPWVEEYVLDFLSRGDVHSNHQAQA